MATPIPANSCPFTLDEIARATGGTIAGSSDAVTVRGVSIDSRSIEPGMLFVALRGARDGHAFMNSAVRRGAAAVLAEGGEARVPVVRVGDTLAALGTLARFHLARERAARVIPSIAIAGSAGKTTTKEIVAALAGALFGRILATPGNLNNLIGVPMTLLTLEREHRAIVLECGTNTRGEIARLGAIFKPDTTLVLNVDIEHSEGLGTIDEIADEETALLKFTARTAVAPCDDPRIQARIPARLQRITFGDAAGGDVRLARRTVTVQGHARIRIALAPALVEAGIPPQIEAELALLGAQSALNAAAGVACAAAMWARPFGASELAAIGEALAGVRPVAGRLATIAIGGVIVIDDSYNSNPRSARAALAAAGEIARDLGARLIVAMGDMLELGPLSAAAHAELIAAIATAGPAEFVAVGSALAAAYRATQDAGDQFAARARLTADSVHASAIVNAIVRRGDVLLVKGSRGVGMERIIEGLKG
jgi:UDP-N-acetylmuramoyl-tripeptide--D-alanyl-D-alanine ligase